MSSDDWNFLLAGFGIMVLPFLLFVLWTFVPMSDRRVAEWFAAYGRLHRSAVPVVRRRLLHVRWHRRVGALLGGLAVWAGTSASVVGGGDGDVWDGAGWLPLVGYVCGAVVAELRAVRMPSGRTRVAELSPRRTSDYLAPWVLPAQYLLTAACLTMVTVAPLVDDGSRPGSLPDGGGLVLHAAGIVAVVAAGHLAARRVVRAPVRRDPGLDPYLDDAFRQMAVLTCLAAGSMAAVALGSGPMSSALVGRGWWQLVPLALYAPLLVALWVALRQPVPWTFGPRIRSAWATATDPADAAVPTP